MSLRLLLDENIPPEVATKLQESGYDVVHVREAGMKGHEDPEIVAFASHNGRCLVTLDADFGDIRRYGLGTHSGIIRLRIKFAPSGVVLGALLSLLPKLEAVPIGQGALVVSDGKKYKLRLPKEPR